MALRLSSVVAITGKVQEPAFTTEFKHMLLALVNNEVMPSTTPWIEFKNITNFGLYFGKTLREYQQVLKYFSRLSKTGLAPEKVVIANWYKTAEAPFYKGKKIEDSIADLQAFVDTSFTVSFDEETYTITPDLTGATSYDDIATEIQTLIQANTAGGVKYTGATCTYNTITGGFIIKSGATGKTETVEAITATTGLDFATAIGLIECDLSQGVDAETWTDFCDRIYQSNSSGYSITTMETLTSQDVLDSVEWLQTVYNGQTYNTQVRLVFNFSDKSTAEAIQSQLQTLGYSGSVMCYDPYGEYINILSCSICASIDYESLNGSINFNFQPADGYTSITNYGSVVDYQDGLVNNALAEELDSYNINYVYSLGTGTQETIYYGKGKLAGDFSKEDIQVNESWLESEIQVNVVNAFNALNKIKLQGDDAKDLMTTLISPAFDKAKENGVVARNGELTETSKLSIVQATGNSKAPECVENNGYYLAIKDIDTTNNRVNVVACYLCGGAVDEVRIVNNIFTR